MLGCIYPQKKSETVELVTLKQLDIQRLIILQGITQKEARMVRLQRKVSSGELNIQVAKTKTNDVLIDYNWNSC